MDRQQKKTNVNEVLIQTISDTVIEKLRSESVNFIRNRPNADRYPSRIPSNRTFQNTKDKTPRKCRKCGNTSHLVRRCPNRYCASCGNKDMIRGTQSVLNIYD